ncbi:LysR family substrate-binding domain-containing protein [Azoarcus sp. KH32C]|uniref:LysR family substrate-binding domain-containing protein n=1 Tax=Azoarcus sp. KH32C TaxID=748247 RepID=UPI0018D3E944|nr:LysR family substrate-binding domain-containing protein [Azoarcus sp. KH32C]
MPPLAATARIRLASLADESFVMFSRHVSPQYFDSLISACRASGFSPRILNEVRSVASQIAFVGCGQGIAPVPSTLRNIAPDSVVVRPLKENVSVVTTAVAWSTARENPLLHAVIATISASIAPSRTRRRKIQASES